jgi:cell division protein ZapA (FtsZ GTPase activity inhibitor)
MITEQLFQIEIARIKMEVPVYKDINTTRAIGRELDERIKEIAKATKVIDTQKNAVVAAFDCLVEMHALMEDHEEDIRELTKALERIASQMKALEKRFHLESMQKDED